MKKIISMFVFATFLFITGCISIMERTESGSKITQVYHPTCTCAESIALPFRERRYGEDGIAQSICTVLLPCTIIDLPLDAVMDTVCLPWDIYRTYQNKKPNTIVPNNDSEVIEKVN